MTEIEEKTEVGSPANKLLFANASTPRILPFPFPSRVRLSLEIGMFNELFRFFSFSSSLPANSVGMNI